MNIITEIMLEIEILEVRLYDLEREHRHLWNMCFPMRTKLTASYSSMPGTSSQPLPVAYTLRELMVIETKLEDVRGRIKGKWDVIKAIKEKMAQLEGLEQKVVYMRDVEDKSLQEIADTLNLSYSLISKISMKCKNEKSMKDLVANR